MTTATLPSIDFDSGLRPRDLVDPGDRRANMKPGDRGGPTLDELLVSAWEGLRSDHPVECPVCGGPMRPRYAAGPRPVGGRCGSCGSELL